MRHLPFAITFLICLLIGYQAGVSLGISYWAKDNPPDSPYARLIHTPGNASADPPAATLPNGQRSILMVGVDNLDSSLPRLESIWLISYVANSTRLTFLPVFPSDASRNPGGDPARGNNLPVLFQLVTHNGLRQLDPSFLEAVREEIPWWSNYIVVDEVSLSAVMGRSLDSLDRDETRRPGNPANEIADKPPHAWEDPRAALAGQAEIYQEMCWQATLSGPGLEFDKAIQRYPTRIFSDLNHDQFLAELNNLSVHISKYSCEFPTIGQVK